LAGVLPAAMAYVGALIIDAVVAARPTGTAASASLRRCFRFTLVALEAGMVAALAGAQRGCRVPVAAARPARPARQRDDPGEGADAELAQFEDSEFYDKLTRARREASTGRCRWSTAPSAWPRTLVSLVSYGVLLVQFSPLGVLVLVVAGLPAFVAEAKFSGDAFRLFRWRSPETRMQMYLETVLAREDTPRR
jgi:ATP-binding cassette, subfamily B, bacterial